MDGQGSSGGVDFSVLQSYARGDESFVREVLVLFRADAETWGSRLASEAPDWRAIVHTLKGTARTIGALELGDLCERAEREGAGVLPRVHEALNAAVAEIDAYLP